MKRIFLVIVAGVVGVLLVPSGSLATLTELGDVPLTATPTITTQTAPSCPSNPCYAVSRTTGYQAKVGTARSPLIVPANGRIVAWSIDLGKPNAKQITYFNTNEGGTSSAAIAVLKPGLHLNDILVSEGPVEQLQQYFGQTVQFALPTSIPVTKGELIALTVPTWAPALALGFGNDTSWRASRARSGCSDTTTETAHTTIGTTIQYYCLYRTARLTYTATFVPDPVPTSSLTTTTTRTKTTSSTKTSSTRTSSTKTSSTRTSTSTRTTSTSRTSTSTSTSKHKTSTSKTTTLSGITIPVSGSTTTTTTTTPTTTTTTTSTTA